MALNYRKNQFGYKDSNESIRDGGQWKQWTDFIKINGYTKEINTKELRDLALSKARTENPQYQFKAVKLDNFYRIYYKAS